MGAEERSRVRQNPTRWKTTISIEISPCLGLPNPQLLNAGYGISDDDEALWGWEKEIPRPVDNKSQSNLASNYDESGHRQ